MSEFLTAPRPIRAVLVANRGEIACRILGTCRRLGLRGIAVFSEADADALHVRLADAAEPIGPAAPAESYLDIPAVIAAALRAGADAVHPGYGFLSENAAFARACAEAGLVFVGPSPEAIAAMGSKIEARAIAEEAGVPVVPGYRAQSDDSAEMHAAAARLGWPVMVKASAGGGGRGMRRVDRPEALDEALRSASAEARTAFGDGTLFLERLIVAPRHLEVQVFGDGRGDVLHFFERDCSVQRNHQKLIEEAPAPNLPDTVRAQLHDSAVRLAGAIGYSGAGTVEFIMEAGGETPYFLEMNTRLQVEHPVTEAICGVDLVALQLRQAAGLPLGLSQSQIEARGHAIEVRLNVERPDCGFLPQSGRFIDVVPPPGLRFDSGVAAGSEVGSHYDSLVAKLISHGPDRDAARQQLIAGLEALAMPGMATNQAFLADCLRAPDFAEGEATTDFLVRSFPEGWAPDRDQLLRLRGQGALVALGQADDDPLRRPDGLRTTGPRRPAAAPLRIDDDFGGCDLVLRLGAVPEVETEGHSLSLADAPPLRHWRAEEVVHACAGGLSLALRVRPLAEASLEQRAGPAQAGHIRAPLAGLVSCVHVAEGDSVRAGDALIEMQAMKLVHSITAPFDGRILQVACRPGETLGATTLLIEMEEEG